MVDCRCTDVLVPHQRLHIEIAQMKRVCEEHSIAMTEPVAAIILPRPLVNRDAASSEDFAEPFVEQVLRQRPANRVQEDIVVLLDILVAAGYGIRLCIPLPTFEELLFLCCLAHIFQMDCIDIFEEFHREVFSDDDGPVSDILALVLWAQVVIWRMHPHRRLARLRRSV